MPPTDDNSGNRTSDEQQRAFGKFGKVDRTARCCCRPFIAINPIATTVTTATLINVAARTVYNLLLTLAVGTKAADNNGNRTSDGQRRTFGKLGKGEMTAPCCCHPFVSFNPIATTVTTAGLM